MLVLILHEAHGIVERELQRTNLIMDMGEGGKLPLGINLGED